MPAEPVKPNPRPLSPHLQIYKWQLTSVMSILHRFCGIALAIGTVLVTWLLIAAATGPDAYAFIHNLIITPLGTFMIFGWSVALFYHLCNGVRHLIWDTVHLFKIENAYRAGYVVLFMTVLLTAIVWGKVWFGS
jgi:succinate dehydrogenase / fumarate reductase cytochrome b subunit